MFEEQRLEPLESLPDDREVILEAARGSPASDGLLVRPRAEADEHVRPLTVSEQCPVRARKRPQRPVTKLLPRLYEVALTTRRHRPCCVCPGVVHDSILSAPVSSRGRREPSTFGRFRCGDAQHGPDGPRRYMRKQCGARAAWSRRCSCATSRDRPQRRGRSVSVISCGALRGRCLSRES